MWLKQNWFFLVITGILLTVLLTLFGDKIKAWFQKKPDTTKKPDDSGNDNGNMPDPSFPLKLNSIGPEVKNLQQYLNHAGSYGLVVDGIFGPKTQAAVTSELGTDQVSQDYYDMFVLPYINGQ